MPIEGEHFYEDYTPGAGSLFRINKLIFEGRTRLQEVLIFENELFGKVLVLDGIVQTTTSDEFIYHEMLTHVPVLAHGNVENILIVGGGDGGTLRQALTHSGAEATMVDIDPELVQLCREHIPEIGRGGFDDPRATVVAGDGFEFVKSVAEEFDVIICDTTDPLGGPGDVLYSQPFFEACRSKLRNGGVLVIQSGVPHHERGRIRKLRKALGSVFRDMTVYTASVPSYFGGVMTIGWGCDDPNIRRVPLADIEQRFEDSRIDTKYYTPDIHLSSFALPQYLRDLIEG